VWEEVPSPPEKGSGEGLDPSADTFLLFDLKMEHFGAGFKGRKNANATGGNCLLLPHTGYAYVSWFSARF